MWIVAYVLLEKGWCVVDPINGNRTISGPYAAHSDAVEAAQTMAWRLAQGWAP